METTIAHQDSHPQMLAPLLTIVSFGILLGDNRLYTSTNGRK